MAKFSKHKWPTQRKPISDARRTHGEHARMADATAKLLIAKSVFTEGEFKAPLSAERQITSQR
jgi:hypothetical protein